MAKTKLVLFCCIRHQRLNQQFQESTILVKGKKIKFNKDAMQWVEIWLDSQQKFTAHIKIKLKKTKIAEIQFKCLSGTYELAPRLIRQIQIAVV